MNINFENPTLLYGLFFSLAHIASWAILLYYGHKHKYPTFRWLLIIVTGYIFFTIGTHVLAVNVENLKLFLIGDGWQASSGKSLIGGLLFAIPAMLLVKNLVGFKAAIFEPYAFTLPIGIAIQRVGCLAAGCCYGNESDFPWAISYKYGHFLHYTQWRQGLVSGSEQSIPLHPVQIYEGILCLMIATLVYYFYKRKRLQNSLIYFSLLLYSIVRFSTEFFRADIAHTLGLNSYLGLNTVQWIMLILITVLLFVLIGKKKSILVNQRSYEFAGKISLKEYLWFILLFAVILTTPKFYSSLELLLLGILLIPLSAFVFWEIFSPIPILKWRAATASVFVLAFFSMSQNSPPVNSKDKKPESSIKSFGNLNEDEKSKYSILSFGSYYGVNKMNSDYTLYSGGGGGCNGGSTGPPIVNSIEDNFINNYFLLAAGYQYINEKSKNKKFTFQSNISYARIVENQNVTINQSISYQPDSVVTNFYQLNEQNKTNNITLNPFVKFDYKGVGFGFGFMVGDFNLYHIDAEQSSDRNNPSSTLTNYNILPQFHFRLGNLRTVWGEVNYAYRFPGISPASEVEFLLGVNFNKGNFLKIGSSSFHYLVIRPQISLKNNIAIEPYVGFGGSLFKSNYTNQTGFEGGINLHYRLKDITSKDIE